MSWKKILFLCLSFIFVFSGLFGFYGTTNAQWASYTMPVKTSDINKSEAGYESTKGTSEEFVGSKIMNAGVAEFKKAAEEAKKAVIDPVGGFLYNAILSAIAWIAQNIILRLAALLAGLSGLLFDTILNFTVIEMAKNMDIGNSNSFINIGWTVLRDVVNIMFIFVLLYVGIMTIIKGFESGTSKMIATVITVALLINFSLFFTKIVIDTSNVVAVNFYSAIKNATDTSSKDHAWQGIAAVFIEKSGMGTLYKWADLKGDNETLVIQGLGGAALLFVLAIVIFIASILFITRYLVLIIVLIASSAAIGSWILPSLKKSIYDKWWSALIGQSFFAPVFFLFLYLTLIFMTKTVGLTPVNETGWTTVFSGTNSTGSINLVVNYMLIVGSLIGTIVVSKSLSNMAGSGAGKITAALGGAGLGLAGFAGRNTLGRLGQTAANSTALQNFAAKSRVGMGLLNVSNKVAKGSYDARNTKAFGAMGVDMGKAGGEGGFQKSMTDAVKKRKDQYEAAGELNDNEKIRKDKLKQELEAKYQTSHLDVINAEADKIKEDEKIMKTLTKTDPLYIAAEGRIAASNATIKTLTDDIERDPLSGNIKAIEKAGKDRQKSYLTNVGKRWMKSNKIAAAEIRKSEEKKKNQTDIDKIIAGIKS